VRIPVPATPQRVRNERRDAGGPRPAVGERGCLPAPRRATGRWAAAVALGLAAAVAGGCGTPSTRPAVATQGAQPGGGSQGIRPPGTAAAPAPDGGTAAPAAETPPGPLPPNERGQVMVLEYHRFGPTDERWQRSPEGFRRDLEALYRRGYRPVNAADLVLGRMAVPRGFSPVVLTFDDGTEGQFRLLPDGRIDPTSAVGILVAFHREHPDWGLRGTFFPNRTPFGQPDTWKVKVRWLLAQGFEVGDHTLDHVDLSRLGAAATQEQLGGEVALLRSAVPDYQPVTLALPYGSPPAVPQAARQGTGGGASYHFAGIFLVGAGPAPSPFDPRFDPLRIPRIQVVDPSLRVPASFYDWLAYFDAHPDRRFVSTGAPPAPSAPPQAAAPTR
jgi:peptidoglycan/xylan/chitin deacetylase (PgdA/CDA1 family)